MYVYVMQYHIGIYCIRCRIKLIYIIYIYIETELDVCACLKTEYILKQHSNRAEIDGLSFRILGHSVFRQTVINPYKGIYPIGDAYV